MDTKPGQPKIRILLSNTHQAAFNLATEEWIFNELDENTRTLFLWRNHDTVVLGRNQNPWSECNLTQMERDQVTLARRTSGGGAVFHDLGNTCFTFLSPRAGYNRSQNTAILLAALARLGLVAEASGRNDLVMRGPLPAASAIPAPVLDKLHSDGATEANLPHKISGSAFRETQKRAFHHGTFLIRTDLNRLANYLTPHPKKLASKGRASVRSRVMNLSEIKPELTHEMLVAALIEAFEEFHGSKAEPEHLDHLTLEQIPELQTIYERFSSWEWRFGHAPQFEQKVVEYLNCGLFEIHFNSEQGRISQARVFSDTLHQDLAPSLARSLVGRKFSRQGIGAAFEALRLEFPDLTAELAEIQEWLGREVEV